MKATILQPRVWDPERKEMASVWKLIFDDVYTRNFQAIEAKFSAGLQYATKNSVLMQNTGLLDEKKVPIFEEDIVDFLWEDQRIMAWRPLRGKVVWNSHLSYGDYGFIILDQDSGIHPFRLVDQIYVVGNTFEGVRK